MGLNPSTTASFSKSTDATMMLLILGLPAGSTAILAILITTSASSPPPTSRNRSIHGVDGVLASRDRCSYVSMCRSPGPASRPISTTGGSSSAEKETGKPASTASSSSVTMPNMTYAVRPQAPTWPRARLHYGTRGIVVLNLEWKPHSRIDELALTVHGRIPAPELRALFQRLRRLGPANTLYPSGCPGALPEMACFSLSSSLEPYVDYKTGEDNNIPPPLLASFSPMSSDRWLLWCC